MNLEQAYNILFAVVLSVQGVFLFLCLIRSIIGPTVSDRIVAVNMVGTNTIALIAELSIKMGEGYLSDIGLIYAMLSFLAVVLLTKVYMGAYRERKAKEEQQKEMSKS